MDTNPVEADRQPQTCRLLGSSGLGGPPQSGSGFWVRGFGVRVLGLGFKVSEFLGFRGRVLGLAFWVSRFQEEGSRFGVFSGFRGEGSGFGVLGFRVFRFQGEGCGFGIFLGFRGMVLGLGFFRVSGGGFWVGGLAVAATVLLPDAFAARVSPGPCLRPCPSELQPKFCSSVTAACATHLLVLTRGWRGPSSLLPPTLLSLWEQQYL